MSLNDGKDVRLVLLFHGSKEVPHLVAAQGHIGKVNDALRVVTLSAVLPQLLQRQLMPVQGWHCC